MKILFFYWLCMGWQKQLTYKDDITVHVLSCASDYKCIGDVTIVASVGERWDLNYVERLLFHSRTDHNINLTSTNGHLSTW